MLFANPHHRTILGIWTGWMLAMLAFHVFLPARLTVRRPDTALAWTATETEQGSQAGKVYLTEPFLNRHVSWDSEYYLAIAIGGYEDPNIGRVQTDPGIAVRGYWPLGSPAPGPSTTGLSKSYAFLPFYPVLIRLLCIPLSVLGLNAIATATLAGVMLSMLGALVAMMALYEFGKVEMDDPGGLRAAFYLLIFPSGFFLAEVYAEGVFIGLAFGSLLVLRRGHIAWAALLAVFATLTRAVGVALALPLLLWWIRDGRWRTARHGLLVMAPIITFALWRGSFYGEAFTRVQGEFFGRRAFVIGETLRAWSSAWTALWGANPQAAAYAAVEWLGSVIGFTACIAGLRRHPDLALFGLVVIGLSFTSGPPQGMYRYVIAAPPVCLFLARLGKSPVFDRVWTGASLLIMSVMCAMFMFDMWAG